MGAAFAGILAVLFVALAPSPGSAAPSGRVTILHFNDFHSQMEPFAAFHEERLGGVAHLAGAVELIRREAPDALLFCAGDIFQGTPYYNVFGGRIEVAALNLMETDALAPGNHEFDSGIDSLRAALAGAEFPVLAANLTVPAEPAIPPVQEPADVYPASRFLVRSADPTEMHADLPAGRMRLAAPYAVYRAGPVTVGVVGATTEELERIVFAPLNPGLRAEPAAAALEPWVAALSPQVDLLVVLSHRGVAEDSALAASLPGIDVIVTGHDHRALREPLLVANETRNGLGGTLIVAAGSRGTLLGRLDLELRDGRIAGYRGRVLPVGPAIPPDPEVAALVEMARAQLGSEMDEVIAEAPLGLSAEGKYLGDSPLGNLVADVMRAATGADLAVQNSGGIRASLPPGPIRRGDVFTVLPFENRLVVCTFPGTGVLALSDFIAGMPAGAVKAQVSGLSFRVEGGRAVDVRVNGDPIEPARAYRVAVNDFMAYGGDGYDILAGADHLEFLDLRLRDAFLAHLERSGEVVAPVETRIRR